MNRQLIDEIAPPIYAVFDFTVILVPALAVKLASDRGGMGDAEGVDLIVASAILGVAHAALAWVRLRSEERIAVRRADMWIAAFDSLVVLTFGATILLVAILYGFADEHASLVDRGYPVVVLWIVRSVGRNRRGRGHRSVRVLVARATRSDHQPAAAVSASIEMNVGHVEPKVARRSTPTLVGCRSARQASRGYESPGPCLTAPGIGLFSWCSGAVAGE